MKLVSAFLLITSVGTFSLRATDRGTILLKDTPAEVLNLIDDEKINLIELRLLTNFLTNPDIREFCYFEEICYPIPSRKKAFIRHIKKISEQLEFNSFNNYPLQREEMELLSELVHFYESLKQAAISGGSPVTRRDQLQMVKDYKRSKRIFQYQVQPTDLSSLKIPNTIFWHELDDTLEPYERFDQLAAEKRIRARKRMVIVFDELSYSGSAPKVRAMDLDYDNEWSLKWGDEVHTDVLGSRIFASLGYDVDHPYHYGKDEVTLVFDGLRSIKNYPMMRDSIFGVFKVDISPFITSYGIISDSLILNQPKLAPFKDLNYVRFVECGLEGRPDRVKRIGSFLPDKLNNNLRQELRGALLAHAFIDNWDTRELNTLLTLVHDGNYNYRISAVFSDLGTSLGVHMNQVPADFKVGLVNELEWECATLKGEKVSLNYRMNSILKPYAEATYSDLRWMANRIAALDSVDLREMIGEAGWPAPIEEVYFHKMASRRASIVAAFGIEDKNPVSFKRDLTITVEGETIVRNGVLMTEYKKGKHPEKFLSKKGRMRNYGY